MRERKKDPGASESPTQDDSQKLEEEPPTTPNKAKSVLFFGSKWVDRSFIFVLLLGPMFLVYMSLTQSFEDRFRPRAERDETPYPCKKEYGEDDIFRWANEHIDSHSESDLKKHMILLLGGSGSGKGTAIRYLNETGALTGFVFQGLDDYLMYLPEYKKSLSDEENVYKNAADQCYTGARLVAKKAIQILRDTGRPVIYEDTGKNLARILKRGLPPFLEKGYQLTVIFIDNLPDIAVKRAQGRFQRTGRYSPDDYLRDTFLNVTYAFEHIAGLEETRHSIYCDNSCLGKTGGHWSQAAILGDCMKCYHHSGQAVIDHFDGFPKLEKHHKLCENYRQEHQLYLDVIPPKE